MEDKLKSLSIILMNCIYFYIFNYEKPTDANGYDIITDIEI